MPLGPRALLIVAALTAAPPTSAATLWVEGEDAAERETFANPWFGSLRPGGLSGGEALTSFSEPGQPRGRARYEIPAPAAGTHTLWARVITGDGHLGWRLGDGERQEVDLKDLRAADREAKRAKEPTVRDERNLAADGDTDARYAAWVRLGEVELAEGPQRLTFWFGDPDADKAFAGLDAFLLSGGPFEPRGALRPAEPDDPPLTADPADTWAFDPPEDRFDPAALVDLRSLNEAEAGESGFVRLSGDREGFVRGDGQPLRLWGGTEYNQRTLDLESLTAQGRFLAKRGVNVARWHGDLPVRANWPDANKPGGEDLGSIDEENLDEAFKLVAAMKPNGIYTVLSPYWGPHTKPRASWSGQYPDPGSGNLAGLVFFVPEVQAAYRGWLRALLTRPNPYTGVPLRDEPAVALLQLQNEDSLLFFTAGRIRGEAGELLRRLFRDWLVEQHGSVEAVQRRWQGFTHGSDGRDWENGLPALLHPWDYGREAMQQKGSIPGFRERRADQLAFMAHTMRRFNEETAAFLRDELGAPQLINAGNWRTSDPWLVDDAERWSYAGNEVMAKNHYFDALHTGRTRGWQVLPDHVYTSASATRDPEALPTNLRQPLGFPFLVTESLWVPPSLYEAEGPLIVASQQAQNGVDAFFWFSSRSPRWEPAVKGEVAPKWSYNTPMTLGQFPAAALLYRRALVPEADPVVVEARPMAEVFAGKPPLLGEPGAFDPNRDEGIGNSDDEPAAGAELDRRAFLVGPVRVDLDAELGQVDEVKDLSAALADGVIRGASGAVEIRPEPGIYLIDAPRVQAAVGFLGEAGPVETADLKLDIDNGYAAVAAVSLDDRPLAESENVLVQLATTARPRGWAEEAIALRLDGEEVQARRIVDTGETPWRVERLRGTLWIANPRLTRATVTDANLEPVRELAVSGDGGGVRLDLPEDALYVVLRDGAGIP